MSGCIDFDVARLNGTMNVLASANFINAEVSQVVAVLDIDVRNLSQINAAVSAKNVGIDFSAGIICDVPRERYLIVDEGIIWLVPENGYQVDVNVKSNVRWTIN